MYEYQVYNFKYLKKTHNASGGWLDESRVDLKINRYVQRLLPIYIFKIEE